MPASGIRVCGTLLFLASLMACGESTENVSRDPASFPERQFVGSAVCADCHAGQTASWQGSHHDHSMQRVTADTVLGDFSEITHRYYETEFRFSMRDGKYWVSTLNEVGERQEFEIAYTFGVFPLQQYLIALSGGRLQPLAVAWDSRDAQEGGQRWFHLYPNEYIGPNDPLHWTGPEQNWNFMCAECHSTNLVKNFDRGSRSYDTTWSEINVGCEACHGPASRHVALIEAGDDSGATGLAVDLDDGGGAVWQMNTDTGIAERSRLRMRPPQQLDACGRCHSRRSQLSDGYDYGQSLLDTHMPSLLDDGLYFADGQIRDEVYVWGSFLQSKMYQQGVSCTDCHDAHGASLKTGAEPSQVCASCHLPDRFATSEHHRHAEGQVECVDCHMPSRDYMVVDGRRDHSFRIPRPDLTVSTGSPNACGDCHEAQGAEWAEAILRNWYGNDRPVHYAEAIHAGRNGAANANSALARVSANADFPGIARATALSLLAWPLDTASVRAIREGLGNGDGLIRLGALRALQRAPADVRLDWVTPLLDDPVLAVRLEAVSVLLPLRSSIAPTQLGSYADAENEYLEAQLAIAERPEAYTNLGGLFLSRGDLSRAERSFQTALQIQPLAVSARVNLADLYRQQDRDDDAHALLEEGVGLDPANAALHHSLGLLLVRQGDIDTAMDELRQSVELDPGNSRYTYVYAVALNSIGNSGESIAVLRDARRDFEGDFDIAWALVTTLRDAGEAEEARAAAATLRRQFPDNPDVASLLETITEQNLSDQVQ